MAHCNAITMHFTPPSPLFAKLKSACPQTSKNYRMIIDAYCQLVLIYVITAVSTAKDVAVVSCQNSSVMPHHKVPPLDMY